MTILRVFSAFLMVSAVACGSSDSQDPPSGSSEPSPSSEPAAGASNASTGGDTESASSPSDTSPSTPNTPSTPATPTATSKAAWGASCARDADCASGPAGAAEPPLCGMDSSGAKRCTFTTNTPSNCPSGAVFRAVGSSGYGVCGFAKN